jgi:hypothetical protein
LFLERGTSSLTDAGYETVLELALAAGGGYRVAHIY